MSWRYNKGVLDRSLRCGDCRDGYLVFSADFPIASIKHQRGFGGGVQTRQGPYNTGEPWNLDDSYRLSPKPSAEGSSPSAPAIVVADFVSFATTILFESASLARSVAPPPKMRLASLDSHFDFLDVGVLTDCSRKNAARSGGILSVIDRVNPRHSESAGRVP